jgi:stearoyl-CoA desaturase (delta-9 desaturase)
MHRMHHAYSDTEKDPHSPHFFKDVFRMMLRTKEVYMDLLHGKNLPDKQFLGNYPEWAWLDRISNSWIIRILWGALYFVFYYFFVPKGYAWLYLLLPIHFLMGPVHGAIVNWCGHKYGYSNYDNHDHSKNTLIWDVLLMGELFQNNHHKDPNYPNFAFKWYELDPTYPIMKILSLCRIIQIRRKPAIS